MKNNTINLVPSGHEVSIVTMVSGEILASTQKGQTKVSRFPLVVKRNRTSKAFVSVLIMSTATGKDIHVASMDVEVIAVIKKNSKK